MVFNSIAFLLFAIVFFFFWPLANRRAGSRYAYLVAMSFFFYGWWDWRFLFLIIGSGLIDYFCGLAMQKDRSRARLYLVLSILGNVGSLSVFKYSGFVAALLDNLAALAGQQTDFLASVPGFTLILPVGISFYTFQSMSYTIDIYRSRLKPTRNILHFFSYLAMFPQLVAGPIIRARDMLFQLAERRRASALQKWHGIKLVIFGLFQKVVIADNLSFFIDSAFEGKTPFGGAVYWWSVMVAFAFQIYCDFSGYSLIARGLAKYMGYHFKMNFNHPYLSVSFSDFWSRWHISLSTWFRDYVYIPLGGSRRGLSRTILYVWITMVISGLWHGAHYTFLLWGASHALLLSLEKLSKWQVRMNSVLIRMVVVFLLTTLAWVFFRAESLDQSLQVFGHMLGGEAGSFAYARSYTNGVVFLLMAMVIEGFVLWRRQRPAVGKAYRRYNMDLYAVALALVMCILFRGEGQQFIYFQF